MESRNDSIFALSIAVIIISIISTGLRIWSRSLAKTNRFWWDDFVALVALPFLIAECAIVLRAFHFGLGKHIHQLHSISDISNALKLVWAGEIVNSINVSLPKISALLFYVRIFERSTHRAFSITIWTLSGLVIAWNIASIFSIIFQCNPVDRFWMPLMHGHCNENIQIFMAWTAISFILDVIILLIPLPFLWRLQMELKKKIGVLLIFLCGYCASAMSIGRLVSFVDVRHTLEKDITWGFITISYWALLEPFVSLLSINLPSVFHLMKHGHQHGLSSLFTSKAVSQRSTSSSSSTSKIRVMPKNFLRFSSRRSEKLLPSDNYTANSKATTTFTCGDSRHHHDFSNDIPLDAAGVRTDIVIREEDRWSNTGKSGDYEYNEFHSVSNSDEPATST